MAPAVRVEGLGTRLGIIGISSVIYQVSYRHRYATGNVVTFILNNNNKSCTRLMTCDKLTQHAWKFDTKHVLCFCVKPIMLTHLAPVEM